MVSRLLGTVGKLFRISLKLGFCGVLGTVSLVNPWMGAGFFGILCEGVKDKTLRMFCRLGLWTVGGFLFYFAWELYVIALMIIFVVLANNLERMYDQEVRDRGFWKGLMMWTWRMLPEVVEPLLGEVVRANIKKTIVRKSPPTNSLRRFFDKNVYHPDHNPYLKSTSKNAAKRPVKGRKRPQKGHHAYDGENLPMALETANMEVGRRYVVDYAVEVHDADDRGPHLDVTFRGPTTGMIYRWAVGPKGAGHTRDNRAATIDHLLDERWPPRYEWNGEKFAPIGIGATQTDGKHGHSHMFNPPVSTEGYGSGKTSVLEKGKAEVWVSDHGNVHIVTDKGAGWTFIEPKVGNQWLLQPLKDAPSTGIPVSYTPRTTEFVDMSGNPERIQELMATGEYVAMEKLDGSFRDMTRPEDRVQLVGRRPEMRRGEPVTLPDGTPKGINVAHKVPGARDLPKEVFPKGSHAEVEVYVRDRSVTKTGKTPFSLTSSRLNAGFGRSAEMQAEDGELIIKMWHLHEYQGDKFNTFDPMWDRMQQIKKDSDGVVHLPKMRRTPEGATNLYRETLDSGGEGIVLVPKDLSKPRIKFKAQETRDFEITGVTQNSNPARGAGAFRYRTPEGGEGLVGSGMSDAMRRDAWDNPEDYVGRQVEVTAHKYNPETGVARKPVLVRVRD